MTQLQKMLIRLLMVLSAGIATHANVETVEKIFFPLLIAIAWLGMSWRERRFGDPLSFSVIGTYTCIVLITETVWIMQKGILHPVPITGSLAGTGALWAIENAFQKLRK